MNARDAWMICLANDFLNASINNGTSRHKREAFILLSSFNKKNIFLPFEQKSPPELPAYDRHLELLAPFFCTVGIYFCQVYSLSLFQSITFPHYCLQQAEQFCLASAQNCHLRVADIKYCQTYRKFWQSQLIKTTASHHLRVWKWKHHLPTNSTQPFWKPINVEKCKKYPCPIFLLLCIVLKHISR